MAKTPLHPAERERVRLALAEIRADLADVESQLSGAYLVKSRQVKATRRALAALASAERALDALHLRETPQPAAPRRRTGRGPGLFLD